jgi:hypothetical protein
MEAPHSRKVRFVKATLKQKGGRYHAGVELAGEGGVRFTGGADGPATERELLRAGALAAVGAAEQASGVAGAKVELEDLALLREFGTQIVLVSLRATVGEETKQLYGVCNVRDDLAAAAALAVLNATNRVLDLA